jgi:hypothetical protein
MQDHLTLRNVELMLARYLQLHPANLSKVINLNLIAAISPFVDIAHQDQLETPEMLAKAAKVSEIYQSAGDLISQQLGESWRWYGAAGVSFEFLGHLKSQLDDFHAHASSALGKDPAELVQLFQLMASMRSSVPAPAAETHRACTEAANTVYEHAQRTLVELARRAQLQVQARAAAYNADPGPKTAKLLLDAHSFPAIVANHGEHAKRCLACLRRLENVVELLEKGQPGLVTVVQF